MQETPQNTSRTCPVCSKDMEYKPIQIWTGKQYLTVQHIWRCNIGQISQDEEVHVVEFRQKATAE